MSQISKKLTSVMLNGKNYHLWARQAMFGLIGRDKLEYVNGEMPLPVPKKPGDPTEEEKRAIRKWKKDDNIVCSWLIATMEPHISEIISYQNSAQAMWEKAENLFSKKRNYAHIYQLRQEIQQIKQSGESVTEIYNKLQKKKEELRMYRPPMTDTEENQKREQQDDVFECLAVLEPSYEPVRSQILLMTELPSLDEVVAMVEREETRRVVMGQQGVGNPESKAFSTTSSHFPEAVVAPFSSHLIRNPRSEARGDSAPYCEHCKNKGHRREGCWFLHPHLRPKGPRRNGGGDRSQGRAMGVIERE